MREREGGHINDVKTGKVSDEIWSFKLNEEECIKEEDTHLDLLVAIFFAFSHARQVT